MGRAPPELTQDTRSFDPMAMALTVLDPAVDPSRLAAHRIRRCTYRRLMLVQARPERVYDVECLYPDRKLPVPLGDLGSATPICNSCTAAQVFRADEE